LSDSRGHPIYRFYPGQASSAQPAMLCNPASRRSPALALPSDRVPSYNQSKRYRSTCDYSGSSSRITDCLAANTESIANNTPTLEKIFRILTRPENAALLKQVADDARSLSTLPLARNVIERDEDAQTIFEGRESILGDRPNNSDVYQRSSWVKSSSNPDKGKETLIEDSSSEAKTLGSREVASGLDSDRFSFVTARSKIIPSIRSIFGSRNASLRSNGSSATTLYGASMIQRVPQTQFQLEMKTPVDPVQTSDGEATKESIDELQDEQKARWG